MMQRVALILVTTLIVVGLACSSDPVVPLDETELPSTLVSPNGNEGAAVLEITGSGIRGIAVEDGQSFTFGDANTIRAVIILNQPGTLDFILQVDNSGDQFSARVIEVADGNNEVRASVSGYRVEFGR